MIFNSFQFLWLFPVIFIVYWGCGLIGDPKLRHNISNGMLLLISYLLYMQWKPAFALFLLGVTAVTYLCARLIEKRYAYDCPKYIILSGVILALLPLFIFKYYNFINDSISGFFAILKIPMAIPGLNYAIPIGISFFTFQAVGYLLDVYYQRIKAEHNWWDYMLFVSFFPQIMSGPITKAASLLPQIKADRPFNYEGAVQGLKWLLWGIFLKVVLADRLGILVDTILPNYMYLSGSTCMLGAILYSFQIYSDFAGYSFMAIGVGRILGFDLINNFRRPYFAATITDFWRRWHISLTKWLTDYIYIPLGGNRCSKLRNYWNIMVTFFVSGIWHGANWTYIVWGGMHGVLQIIEKILGIQKCERRWVKPVRIIITFSLVTLAWIFFRMPDLSSGYGVVSKIFTDFGTIEISASKTEKLFIFGFLFLVLIKEWFEEFRPSVTLLNNKNRIVNWLTSICLVLIIILCGVFDAGQFIYVNF